MKADPLNPRQRKFVELHSAGKSLTDAYIAAGYAARGHSASTSAHQLANLPAVKAALKIAFAEAREAARMTRDDALDWLCNAIRTPIGDIDEKSPLAQEWSIDEIGEATIRTRLKMVGKMDAFKQLALMLNWNAPQEVKHTGEMKIVIGGDI